METKEFLYVYPYSFAEAKRLGQLADWWESHKLNIACKGVIEDAIRHDFDGMHLQKECVEGVIVEFGCHRTAYVLANSLQLKDYDGRFSCSNHDWAKQIYIPPDKDSYTDRNADFAVDSHPAVLDGFVNQYRRAYQALELFDHTHCLPDTGKQDFVGKVIVISPWVLKEECLTQRDQRWLCTGGFGTHAGASGRAVFVICLGDGETTRMECEDFLDVLADNHLPNWAREKLEQFQAQQQSTSEAPTMGGLTIQ